MDLRTLGNLNNILLTMFKILTNLNIFDTFDNTLGSQNTDGSQTYSSENVDNVANVDNAENVSINSVEAI